MREFINLVEGKQQLDEINKRDSEAVDADVDTLKPGESTYADIERLFKKWDEQSSFFSAKSNHFMGRAAKKLGLAGLFAPEGRTLYLTKKDENSTRFATTMVPTGGFFKITGSGLKDEELEKMVTLNMLPDHRVDQFKQAMPELFKNADDAAQSDDAPQSNDELDADARDNSTGRQDGPDSARPENNRGSSQGKIEDGKITFSDGSTFYREESGRGLRLFQQKVGGMIRRMDELVRKMNESIPNSLKAVLSESDKAYLFLEALSNDEAAELVRIVGDLELAIQAEDDQGKFISSTNIGLIQDRIATYKPVIDKAREQMGSGSDNGSSDDNASDETDPDAQRASDASGDQDASVDPGEQGPSGNLEAFAKSGKGGLANDPDEVDAIKELQQYLTDLGFDPNGVDGKYGPGTINAVKEFQDYFGAKVDGDAGPETIDKIIKLRSIRWGEGGSKDFIEWRKTMTRLEELIKKAGTEQSESVDKDSIRGILETLRRLDEALNDAEKEELKAILDELQSAYEDAEFQAALPPNVQKRFSDNYKAGRDALGSEGDLSDRLDGKDGDLSADGEEPTTGPDDGTRGDTAQDPAGGTAEGGQPRPTDSGVQGDYARRAWDVQFDGYLDPETGEKLPNAKVPPRPDEESNYGNDARAWDSTWGETHNPDGTPKEGGAEEPSSQGPEDDVAAGVAGGGVEPQADQFTVQERRGGQGNNRLFGYNVVDPDGEVVAQFGRNERDQAEAEAARLNGGSSTAQDNNPNADAQGDDNASSTAQDNNPNADAQDDSDSETPARKPAEERLNDMLSVDMDGMDLPQLQQFVRDFKADEEIWNMLSPQLKSQLEALL